MSKNPPAQEGEVITDDQKPKTKPRKPKADAVSVSVAPGLEVSTKDLQKSLQIITDQRAVVKEFIQKHLVAGVDYLRIHVAKNCYEYDCQNDKHYGKNILAKPGQEKVFSLFQLTSKLERDEETIAMLPGVRDLVAYKCIVYRNGKEVAEGRGAAAVGDKKRDANATIKIAEKRARMDACLSLGFSEYFTQDMDDPDYQSSAAAIVSSTAPRKDSTTGLEIRPANAPINDAERTVLFRWLTKRGVTSGDEQLALLKLNGVDDPTSMTHGMAKSMITKLINMSFATPPKEIDPGLLGEIDDTPTEPEQPKLIVDDELKTEVANRIEHLGLNSRGKLWLMRLISGRPFTQVEKFTDDEWRKAYDIVDDILNDKVKVADDYVAGLVSSEPEEDRDTGDAVVE